MEAAQVVPHLTISIMEHVGHLALQEFISKILIILVRLVMCHVLRVLFHLPTAAPVLPL